MPTSPPRIGLIVDHPKRDLPGNVLICHELSRRGAESYLIPLYEQQVDVPLLKLDAILVNYARANNLPLVESYARAGTAVYVLDTEGGVLADRGHSTPASLARYIRESGYSSALSGYLFWGRELWQAFVNDGSIAPERLHVTGCPRFDYLAPSWRNVLKPARVGHILINTNFPAVNSRFTGRAQDDRAAIRSAGYADDYIDQLLVDTRKIMDGVIRTVNRLADDFPNQQFVVRPHPFENDAVYHQAFAGHANIAVDGSGGVFEALSGAKALLHLNCGTSIEAMMLGIVPYALEFLNTEHLLKHASLPSRVSRPVHSYEELAAFVAADGRDPQFDCSERYRRIAEPYFYLNDGRAVERVVEVLLKDIDKGTSSLVSERDLRLSAPAARRQRSMGQKLQLAAGRLMGSAASRALRSAFQPMRRDKAFTVQDVTQWLDRLAKHSGRPVPRVRHARHPFTRLPLSSLAVEACARTSAGVSS
jgi:surface carbohydrate biosynthesis protein